MPQMVAAGLIAGLVVACGPKDLAPGEAAASGKPGKASEPATATPHEDARRSHQDPGPEAQ